MRGVSRSTYPLAVYFRVAEAVLSSVILVLILKVVLAFF
jgi:hypothetical protein